MKCMSCEADIPPAWVNAINRNECPGCGGEIMNTSTKELLDELAYAMERMPNDPQGVAGWLLSNYKCTKLADKIDPVEKFHRKITAGKRKPNKRDEDEEIEDSGDDESPPMKVDDSYEKFLKRTDSYAKVKSNTAAIQKLKSGNAKFAQLASQIADIEDPYGDLPSKRGGRVKDEVSAEDMKVYEELKRNGIDPFAGSDDDEGTSALARLNLAQSSGDSEEMDEDGYLPQELELMKTAEGMRAVQKARFKRIKAQDALLGGGESSFRRG